MTIYYSHYGLPNTPPGFSDELPVGADTPYDTPITFRIYDDRGNVEAGTIALSVTIPGPTTLDIIIDGTIQSGYTGTITANLHGGYDVSVIPDGVNGWGQESYDVEAYAADDIGDSSTSLWSFVSVLIARVEGVRAVGRNKIEVEFDRAVLVRPISIKAESPESRYTPVDWSGNDYDAANPSNYSIVKTAGGNLAEAGQSASVLPTWAEENPDHSSNALGSVFSTHVWVYTDYQMTARADFTITISSVVIESAEMPATDAEFVGYVVSQVPRASLKLIESIPAIVVRDDDEGTGDLRKFLNVLQETFDRIVEDIDVFFLELCTVDRIRDEFIDALLWDLGDPFSDLLNLTATAKRKLAGVLVQMYREKGTCDGIVNAVRLFVGVSLSGCRNPWGDAWRLDGGSYGAYSGPDLDELGISTLLAPSEGSYRYSFWLLSPITLTADQRNKIGLIADYVKPAYCIYVGIIEP